MLTSVGKRNMMGWGLETQAFIRKYADKNPDIDTRTLRKAHSNYILAPFETKGQHSVLCIVWPLSFRES